MKLYFQVLGPVFAICILFVLAMPWIVVGFDHYARWVSTFR